MQMPGLRGSVHSGSSRTLLHPASREVCCSQVPLHCSPVLGSPSEALSCLALVSWDCPPCGGLPPTESWVLGLGPEVGGCG